VNKPHGQGQRLRGPGQAALRKDLDQVERLEGIGQGDPDDHNGRGAQLGQRDVAEEPEPSRPVYRPRLEGVPGNALQPHEEQDDVDAR